VRRARTSARHAARVIACGVNVARAAGTEGELVMRQLLGIALVLVAGVFGCAEGASSTIPPSHTSAASEANAAREHLQTAAVMEQQGSRGGDTVVCGGIADGITSPICYSTRRPFAPEELAAEQQRHEAAVHYRVSQALRDAETHACEGVPAIDREESPFAYRDDIKELAFLPDGARVGFRSIRGLTVEWLQHVVDCHLAIADALGHDVPGRAYCPLVPRGATAKVTRRSDGYFIEVRSNDPAAATEIIRRVRALRQ
jgi:hypothetical protein